MSLLYHNDLSIRFYPRLYSIAGRCSSLWFLARAVDSVGSGKAFFPLWWAGQVLNRKESTIWRYLSQCKQLGLFRYFKVTQDCVTIYYSSLLKSAQILGLDELGSCSDEIAITEFQSLGLIATEIETYHLQSQSFYAVKYPDQNYDPGDCPQKPIKNPIRLIEPYRFFENPSCEKLARVLGRSKSGRFAFCSENFRVFGASQAGIAERRGLSVRQIQRHLDNSYRSGVSSVRGFRRSFSSIYKVQILHRCDKSENFRLRSANRWGDDSVFDSYIQGSDGRFWKYCCNLYLDYRWLLRVRARRKSYKDFLSSKNRSRELLDISLSNKSLLKNKELDPGGVVIDNCLVVSNSQTP